MTVTCPPAERWAALLDGESTQNRAAEMRAHAESCASCRATVAELEETLALLRAPLRVGELDPARVHANVAHAIARGVRPAPSRHRTAWMLAASGLALAAGLLLWWRPSDPRVAEREHGFMARGQDAAPSAARDVGVTLYVQESGAADAGVQLLASTPTVTADARYLVAYTTQPAQRTYHLIVVAVDAVRELHWIAPVYLDPGAPLSSVPLAAGRAEAWLATSVALDAPARGPLTVFALVADHPLDGRLLERLAPASRDGAGIAAALPGVDVRSLAVNVVRR